MTNIILVDDHTMVRRAMSQLLESETECRILAAVKNGDELFEQMERVTPTVVLLDLNLPGMPGMQVLENVRKRYPLVFVVILSMLDDAPIVARALQAGARGYVFKASDFTTLKAALTAVTNGQTFVDPKLVQIMLAKASEPPLVRPQEPHQLLSRRERQVFDLLLAGMTPTHIANKLFVSVKTVSTHKRHIMEKLALNSLVELFLYASNHNLMPQSAHTAMNAMAPHLSHTLPQSAPVRNTAGPQYTNSR
ncbi:MAG: response regulator transcription factor [Serpentinimonas sp.]|jgi:DNA-binding NarL/FixJ family response regulator|nr:response regulator transcription factor [Serpentinimonas sp.]